MVIPGHVAAFWADCCESAGGVDEARFCEAFCFGDGQELADALAELVVQGTKHATTGALWSFEAEGRRLPAPGDLSVVTDWSGRPRCIIETLAVAVVLFDEVGAEFAAVEGEGDGSLAYWQHAHRAFFGRECAAAGRQFTEDMLVACERFQLVYLPPGLV